MEKTHQHNSHAIQEKFQAKLFHLLSISTDKQYAHIFTKALDHGRFNTIVSKLEFMNIHPLP